MRITFLDTLVRLAEKDPRIVFLTADLGYTVVERFADRFPERFFNAGAAEQNMVGVATGLADAGFLPFVYSIMPFATLRPLEFIRNGPVFHRLPVRIVGVGPGFEYGPAGYTHQGLEDVAALRALEGLDIVCPADAAQARTALEATWDLPGPVYYRLGKDEKSRVPGLSGRFERGRAVWVREGSGLLLAASGPAAIEAAAAADILEKESISCAVLVVAGIAPPPVRDLLDALSSFKAVLTVENHATAGGLGSLACELAAGNGLGARVRRLGVSGAPDGVCGSRLFLEKRHGLSREAIAQAGREILESPP